MPHKWDRDAVSAIAVKASALNINPRVPITGAWLNQLHPGSREPTHIVLVGSTRLPAVHHSSQTMGQVLGPITLHSRRFEEGGIAGLVSFE